MLSGLCNGAYGHFDICVDECNRGQDGFYFQHYTEDDRFITNNLFTFITNKKIPSSGDILILETGELIVGDVKAFLNKSLTTAQAAHYDKLNKYYLGLVADSITIEQWRVRLEKQKEALRRYIKSSKTASLSHEYTLHDVFDAITCGDVRREAPWLGGNVNLVDDSIKIEFMVRMGDVDYSDDIASSVEAVRKRAVSYQLDLCRKAAWAAERGSYSTPHYAIKADDFITADTSTVWYHNVITVNLRSNLCKKDYDSLMTRLDGLIHNKRRPKRNTNKIGARV